jgi:hypothetical protein
MIINNEVIKIARKLVLIDTRMRWYDHIPLFGFFTYLVFFFIELKALGPTDYKKVREYYRALGPNNRPSLRYIKPGILYL